MKQSILLKGVDRRPQGDKGDVVATDRLHGLTLRDGLLIGIALTTDDIAEVAAGTRLMALHEGTDYRHLLLTVPTATGHACYWTTAGGGDSLHRLDVRGDSVNAVAAVGDLLCLTTADDTCYALWDSTCHDYLLATADDLAYDLVITQDDQTAVSTVQPIDSSLRNYLLAPEKPLQSRPTLAGALFTDCFAAPTAYATNATLIRAAVESALDRMVAERGNHEFRHIVFGIAAVRLYDGRHTLLSPVFALLPAQMSETATADYTAGELRMKAWLHRHTVTATLRNTSRAVERLVKGIDIYLSRPVTFQSVQAATAVVRDGEGRATSLTYPYLGLSDTEALFRRLDYTHALHIGIDEMGEPLLLHPSAADGESLDRHNSGHLRYGAQLAFTYQGRLHLGDVTTLIGAPHHVGISYRYPTLTAAARIRATAEERAGELLAGLRRDISDSATGGRAQAVWEMTTDSLHRHTAVYSSEVAYPLPGALQVISRHATALTLHLRVTDDSGTERCYRRHVDLGIHGDHDSAEAAYAPSGGIHHTTRPAFHTLLLQEVHGLTYDSSTGRYLQSYGLWEEESAEAFAAVMAQSSDRAPLGHVASRLLWSAQDNPLVIGESDQTIIGSAPLRSVTPGTSRTSNGLIGEYPLYAFTDEGVWALRQNAAGQWHATQPVCREGIRAGSEAVPAGDSAVFLSSRGVIRIKGNRTECLSLPLGALPDDFWQGARLFHDNGGHLLLINMERGTDGVARYPEGWVFNSNSDTWGTLSHTCHDIMAAGGDWWGITEAQSTHLSLLRITTPTSTDFDLLTRPFAMGKPLALKRFRSLSILSQGDGALHLRLEGSHDACHWECIGIGTTALSGFCGTPYRWFRLHLWGHCTEAWQCAGIDWGG